MEAGSRFGILGCHNEAGLHLLAVFSDWDAVRKWTDQRVTGMVMPAKDVWGLAETDYDGVVLNPGGPSLELSLERIQAIQGLV